MKVFRYFRVAVESIGAHKMRAMLTMLGIIIGVGAVLVTVGIGSGAAADITERIESGGTNLLTVSGGSSRGVGGSSTLTVADAEALADPTAYPDIRAVAPQYSSNTTIINGTTEGSYQTVGTTATYPEITNKTVANGSFFTEEQVESNVSVVVLGATVASDLFGNVEPVGQSVRIDNNLFQVVGVLEEAGGSGFGSSDTQVFVPLEVALGRLFNVDRYRGSYTISTISVQVISSDRIDAVELQIEQLLRLRHRLSSDDENDFTISNQADFLEIASDVSGTLSSLLGSIGAVSLFVGGIGIMNIMLVSVTERTREIGLRRALGAHDSDILLQFLIEALVLCTLGGAIGVGLSYGVAYGVAYLLQDASVGFISSNVIIETWSVMLAMVVSMSCGFIFGLYPAIRATKLDPIDALRFE